MKEWSPSSWRQHPARQQPIYGNADALADSENRLSQYPPLVFESELSRLQGLLAQVGRGEAFLLQGGDCAESFGDFRFDTIRDNFRILLQMAVILTFGSKRPVVKVGRMAGQFAKPRSSEFETREGRALPAYRGDIVNGFEFASEAREPDPSRMEKAYFHSAATLNALRGLSKSGFADLQRLHEWNLEFVGRAGLGERYEQVARRIDESMAFLRATGMRMESSADLSGVEFFTSHEALLLRYEEAMTRRSESGSGFYSGSGHMLWIGERTRQTEGAHVEYARGVSNPIGLKCGPDLRSDDLLRLIDRLNPRNEPGRLTLITRFGASKIEDLLPKLVRRVKGEGRHVVWCCDPMHGNTFATAQGTKTRSFQDILSETKSFFAVHEGESTIAGGVHFELTGRNVTECVGGGQDISERQIDSGQYETLCDPRLNASQALELAFQLVR